MPHRPTLRRVGTVTTSPVRRRRRVVVTTLSAALVAVALNVFGIPGVRPSLPSLLAAEDEVESWQVQPPALAACSNLRIAVNLWSGRVEVEGDVGRLKPDIDPRTSPGDVANELQQRLADTGSDVHLDVRPGFRAIACDPSVGS